MSFIVVGSFIVGTWVVDWTTNVGARVVSAVILVVDTDGGGGGGGGGAADIVVVCGTVGMVVCCTVGGIVDMVVAEIGVRVAVAVTELATFAIFGTVSVVGGLVVEVGGMTVVVDADAMSVEDVFAVVGANVVVVFSVVVNVSVAVFFSVDCPTFNNRGNRVVDESTLIVVFPVASIVVDWTLVSF